jgi:hypothetical protein
VSPSLKIDDSSTNNDFFVLWNPKFYYSVHSCPPPQIFPVLNQMKLVPTL